MRILLDTCIVVFFIEEKDKIGRDVMALLTDYDNELCVSMETIRELIIAFRRKRLFHKRWKSPEDIVTYLKEELCITILPIHEEHIRTYARLTINEQQGHNDPSDHLIIAHAITEKMPLISSDHKFDFYRPQGLNYVCNS